MSTSETIALTPLQRKNLKSHAHHLNPVVMIGNEGLSGAVLKAIEEQLNAHDLIKIRVFSDDRDARAELHAAICAELGAAPVQHIGKLLVIWRPGTATSRIDPDLPYLPEAPAQKRSGGAALHTPKKLAAAGKKAVKKTVKRKTSAEETENTLARRIRQATEQSRKRTTRRGARRSR